MRIMTTKARSYRLPNDCDKTINDNQLEKGLPTKTASLIDIIRNSKRATKIESPPCQDRNHRSKEYLQRKNKGESNMKIGTDMELTREEEREYSLLFETLLIKDLRMDIPKLTEIIKKTGKTIGEAIKYIISRKDKCILNYELENEALKEEIKELRKALWASDRQVWLLRSELQKERARKMPYVTSVNRFTPKKSGHIFDISTAGNHVKSGPQKASWKNLLPKRTK